ncbi:hypothetical protein NDU88_008399 [Pleurodeles waltl]|uniref:Secreted protein n=1 Tax=Pleurodeles waltl TaxID=8319 RepID=A0AAV7QNF5_PLEWA|nr:hypothetical protein NDU88_008399 [Pleurodeles waltl]
MVCRLLGLVRTYGFLCPLTEPRFGEQDGGSVAGDRVCGLKHHPRHQQKLSCAFSLVGFCTCAPSCPFIQGSVEGSRAAPVSSSCGVPKYLCHPATAVPRQRRAFSERAQ